MDGPPPPPPPHGANPNTTEGTPRYRKSTDLPDGPYDIFVIPPHSAGGGFIYLPSLQCHRNSFIAGSLSTLAVVALWMAVQPIVKPWLATTNATRGMGVILLVIAVGLAGWYFGTLQNDGGSTRGNPSGRPRPGAGFANGFQYGSAQPNPGGPYPGGGPAPNPQYNNTGSQYNPGGASQPPPFNNHGSQPNGPGGASQPPPFNNHSSQPNGATQDSTHNNAQNDSQNSAPKEDPKKAEAEWEKAREETRRKEEIRRKMEAYRRKREAEEAERRRQQEREAMERELKQRKEELEREAAAAKAAAEKEIRERAEREAAERAERLRREEEERAERARREAAEREEKARKEEERARREAAEREESARREAAEREEKAKKEAAEKEAAAKEAAKKEAAARFAAAKEAAAKAKAASQAPAPSTASAPAPAPPRTPSPKKPPPPSARGADVDDDSYSFRPYDRPRRPYGSSAPSVYSESSYAPSHSTARTTPPPSHRGPYMTKDPDKVIIRGVYLFNNAFQKSPIAQLVSGQGSVTDGLVLRITTEGLFIDDDVRGVAQREWDVKAWTLKSVETIKLRGLQVVRASVRDQEGKRYVFVLGEGEVWKVTLGFKKLKSGSQARHLSQSELPKNEANTYLTNLGY